MLVLGYQLLRFDSRFFRQVPKYCNILRMQNKIFQYFFQTEQINHQLNLQETLYPTIAYNLFLNVLRICLFSPVLQKY